MVETIIADIYDKGGQQLLRAAYVKPRRRNDHQYWLVYGNDLDTKGVVIFKAQGNLEVHSKGRMLGNAGSLEQAIARCLDDEERRLFLGEPKLHKGMLHSWSRSPFNPPQGLGYRIYGLTEKDGALLTSYVVAHDTGTGEIETVNSRYTLLGEDQSVKPR